MQKSVLNTLQHTAAVCVCVGNDLTFNDNIYIHIYVVRGEIPYSMVLADNFTGNGKIDTYTYIYIHA